MRFLKLHRFKKIILRNILSIIIITTLIIIFTSHNKLIAQGCVAIRGSSSTCMLSHPEHTNKAGWAIEYKQSNFSVYGNFYYLINPREQNGVRTYREILTPALANETMLPLNFSNRI